MRPLETETIRSAIDSCDMLGALPADVREELSELARLRKHKKGDNVFWEGDPPGAVYIIVEGEIAIERFDEGRGSNVMMAVRGPGEVIGEMSLFEGVARTADARAIESTSLVFLDGKHIVAAIERSPKVAMAMLKTLSKRLRQALDDRMALSQKLESRLARVLLTAAGPTDDFDPKKGIEIPKSLSQSEMAQRASATREHVNKTLKLFRAQRLVATSDDGKLRILNVDKLKRIAEM